MAVVGGGDVAVEDAIFLAGLCKKVYLIHRRDSLRAADSLQKKLMSLSNVEILWNCEVTKIQGEDMVESLVISGKQEKEEQVLEDCTNRSCDRCTGIFAAGDIRKKALRQIITAVADGANAVNSVQSYFV